MELYLDNIHDQRNCYVYGIELEFEKAQLHEFGWAMQWLNLQPLMGGSSHHVASCAVNVLYSLSHPLLIRQRAWWV